MKTLRLTLIVFSSLLFNSIYAQVNIDKFTGDLSYSVPLLSVPGPEGPPVDITAYYTAGIAVEQQASAIGLGWGLDAGGAITRQVSGIPDDWNGIKATVPGREYADFQYGALYLNGFSNLGDFYEHRFKHDTIDSIPAYIPDYDKYLLSGGGLGGEIQPRYFEYAHMGMSQYPGDPTSGNFSKKPQFAFKNDFNDLLESRYFKWEDSPIQGTVANPYDFYSNGIAIGSPSSNKSFEGDAYNDETYYEQYNRNRLRTAKFVEYFTNSEIEDYKANPQLNPIPGGFMEYTSAVVNRTQAGGFDPDGIGAFRITTEAGYTYHYSLPVYVNYTVNGSYDLFHDYSNKDYSNSTTTNCNLCNENGNYVIKETSSNNLWEYKQVAKYADRWLLTAITGPDFEDDGDGFLDDDDKGYWVLFTYTKQLQNYTLRMPAEGFSFTFSAVENDFNNSYTNAELGITDSTKTSGRVASFNIVDRQEYYLSEVRTESHLAQFVTASRNDEQLLRYSGIVLRERYSNEQVKKVEFIQDYRLAPGYYRNTGNVNLTITGDHKSPVEIQNGAVYSRSSSSGKLTLNEIEFYGTGGTKLKPDFVFDYNSGSTTDNPDYNPLRQDYWGFYKANADGKGLRGYATSATDANAWSLRSVTNPLGEKTSFTYERDQYEEVISNAYYGGSRGPVRTFAIGDAQKVSGMEGERWDFELETGTVDFDNLLAQIGNNMGEYGAKYDAVIPFSKIDSSCYCPPPALVDNVIISYHRSYHHNNTNFTGTILNSWLPYQLVAMNHSWQPPMTQHCPNTGVCSFPADLYYAGNGFIRIELDKGWKVYGGNIRVKEMSVENLDGIIYKTRYTYEDGVATNETDGFKLPVLKSLKHYNLTLASRINNKYELGPMVGYSKVTEEDMGASNKSLGKLINVYNTTCADHTQTSGKPRRYYQPIFVREARGTIPLQGAPPPGHWQYGAHMVEIIDEFTTYWGSESSVELKDINGITITKTEYAYHSPREGTTVENFLYDHAYEVVVGGGADITHDLYAVIIREHPNRVRWIKKFAKGLTTTTYNVDSDPVTGALTEVIDIGENNSETNVVKELAFRQPAYQGIGPKSINWKNKNLLTHLDQAWIYKDPTLANTNDFDDVTKTWWTNLATVRAYDNTSGEYENTRKTVPWFSNKSYSWRGPLGAYGLYSWSDFTDIYQALPLNSNWNAFQGTTLYRYPDNWIGKSAEGGTALTANDYQEKEFFVYDKETFDALNTEALPVDPDVLFYDYDLFHDDFDQAYEDQAWIADDFALLYKSDTHFRGTRTVIPDGWRRDLTITLLDERGHALEIQDLNNRYSAKKFCYDNSLIYAEVSNANHTSFTASGFEEGIDNNSNDYAEGEIALGTTARIKDVNKAHTGDYYLSVDPNESAVYKITDFANFQSDRLYRASVWVHNTSHNDAYLSVQTVDATGNPISTTTMKKSHADAIQVGAWILLNLDVEIPNTAGIEEVHVSFVAPATGGADIDDLRFHSTVSPLSVKVMDRVTGLVTAELDNNNYATRLIYDQQQRVVEIWRDIPGVGRKLIEERSYQFSNPF